MVVTHPKPSSRALRGPARTLLLALPFLLSCSGDLPQPRYAPQVTAALVPVGYPPPPARVEIVPAQPTRETVWIDGEWEWMGSKWGWIHGRWVVPPQGARFSPWTTIRDEVGSVYFAGGVWKDAQGGLLSAPAPVATGRSRPGDVTSPEGDDETTAPTPAPAPPAPPPPATRP